MKEIKYSPCNAAYNRYMRTIKFFSWYGLTFTLFPITAAIGGGMWDANLRNGICIGLLILTFILFVYTIIGGGRLRTRRRFYGAVPVPPCYRRDPSCGSLSLPLTIYIIPHQPRFVYWQNNQTSSTFRRTFVHQA